MNHDFEEARKSFIDERIAILQFDSGIVWESESVMIVAAERCWEKYRKANGIIENEQRGLV